MAVCSEIHTKHINKLAQGVSMNVKPAGTHWTSKGLTGCNPVTQCPPVGKKKKKKRFSSNIRTGKGKERREQKTSLYCCLLFAVLSHCSLHHFFTQTRDALRALSFPPHIPTVPLITFLSTGCCHLQQHNLNPSSNTTSS